MQINEYETTGQPNRGDQREDQTYRSSDEASSETYDATTELNLNDQADTTWQWRSEDSAAEAHVAQQPADALPPIVYLPENSQSFAPPANLNQLQHVERSIVSQQPANQFIENRQQYKSPIDDYSIRSDNETSNQNSYNRIEVLNARDSFTENQNSAPQFESTEAALRVLESANSANQGADTAQTPLRDETTDGLHEFVSRDLPSRVMFTPNETNTEMPRLTEAGNPLIVLKSQSADTARPAAQLLMPNFDAYHGAPEIAVDDSPFTPWEFKPVATTPLDYSPSFSAEEFSVPPSPSPTRGESSAWITYSPEPKTDAFQLAKVQQPPTPATPPAEIFAPLPATDTTSAETIDVDQTFADETFSNNTFADQPVTNSAITFQPPVETASVEIKPAARVTKVEFDSPVQNNETVQTWQSQPKDYRAWAAFDDSSTHASTAQPEPLPKMETRPDVAWLSPWWILAAIIPFALYVALRVNDETIYEEYDYDLSDTPDLSPEMTKRPGYSKSDPVYGENDLVLAQPLSGSPNIRKARPAMATATSVHHHENQSVRSNARTGDGTPVLRFEKSSAQQTAAEVDRNSSPNFRKKRTKRSNSQL